MSAFVLPYISCTTIAWANYTVGGKTTKQKVHCWYIASSAVVYAMTLSADGSGLVAAHSMPGFTGLSDG